MIIRSALERAQDKTPSTISSRSSGTVHTESKEDAPLLSTQNSNEYGSDNEHRNAGPSGGKSQSRSSLYLFLLCLGICGLQMAWATELSNGSPYLLSLGISKSWLAMVWFAGPLSGVIVQPVIGSLSDNCKVPYGRRRPYIVAGACLTVLSLLTLAWTKEIVNRILTIFGAESSQADNSSVAIGFAVIWIYILDFSVNTRTSIWSSMTLFANCTQVQASIRAFIVDNAPAHQQDHANAWASRLVGFGNILGYLSGYVNLPAIFPFLGDTQFKVLCAVACILLVATVSISCFYVTEADPRKKWPATQTRQRSLIGFFADCATSYTRLPPQVRLVCIAQFFNWMAWFPFLFYITTYIGQLWLDPIFEQDPDMDPNAVDQAWEEATRFGTFALLIFALVSFAGNSVIPFFIRPSIASENSSTEHDATLLSRFMTKLYIPHLTIRRAWFISHLIFSGCMFSTFFVRTASAAAVLTGIVGISWSLSLWAPFALISTEISKTDARRHASEINTLKDQPEGFVISTSTTTDPETTVELAAPNSQAEPSADQAGVVLGLHNVAVSAPQVISTIVASIVFKFLQRGRGVAGDDSVGWVLRLAGFAALVAAWRTLKIKEDVDDETVDTWRRVVAGQ